MIGSHGTALSRAHLTADFVYQPWTMYRTFMHTAEQMTIPRAVYLTRQRVRSLRSTKKSVCLKSGQSQKRVEVLPVFE